jgi:hypothetical protein
MWCIAPIHTFYLALLIAIPQAPMPWHLPIYAGDFEPHESVMNIFTWVESHLQRINTFTLTSPVLKGRKLPHDGSVETAGLMPSMLLYFNWDDDEMRKSSGFCLSDGALRLIESETQVE